MRRTVVALPALLLVLAGCGGKPAADPPRTHAPTPTVGSSPTPPAMPGLAKEHTEAGAKAFVRYYWDVVNYAQRSLDTGVLSKLGDKYCEGCRKAVTGLDSMREAGSRIVGGANVLGAMHIQPDRIGLWLVNVQVEHSNQAVLGGPSPTSYPESTIAYRMAIVEETEGWLVDRLELQS